MTTLRRAALAALLLAPALSACGERSPTEERERRAREGEGDVVLAAVWPWASQRELLYGEGIDLAVAEVNTSGGIRGRPLRIKRVDDGGSVNEGRLAAQRLAADPEVVAVIGHLQSYVTVPAAAVYDLAGLVLLSPASTSPELTGRGYARVFRATFTDPEVGRQLAEHAAARGYRRIAIHYVRSEYGRALANAFEERAAELGLEMVARHSHEPADEAGEAGLQPVFREWRSLAPDAVFLASEVPVAGRIVAAARRAGITAPVLGGDAMSSPALLSTGGRAVEGTVVAAAFAVDEPRPEVRRFVEAFRARYGRDPDTGAALGYDAVQVLAAAMRQAPTIAPDDVAAALRAVRHSGVTGPFAFDAEGDLAGRRVNLLEVRGGAFRHLAPAAAEGR